MKFRVFLLGIIAGIVMTFGSLAAVSEIEGIRWQPVRTAQ